MGCERQGTAQFLGYHLQILVQKIAYGVSPAIHRDTETVSVPPAFRDHRRHIFLPRLNVFTPEPYSAAPAKDFASSRKLNTTQSFQNNLPTNHEPQEHDCNEW
jgi:hypothetical protein